MLSNGALQQDHVNAPCPGTRVADEPVMRVVDWSKAERPEFLAAWAKLARQAAEPNPFYESWFLLPALQQFDRAKKVRIASLWQGDILIGLMPFSQQANYGRWPLIHVSNWLHHNAFLGEPLVKVGAELLFWQKILGVMDNRGGKALFLHLNGIVVGGALQMALAQICSERDRTHALVNKQERAFLEGPLTAEAYFADAVRSKKRKELRRQKNRLAEMGDLKFGRQNGGIDLDQWTEEFLALESRGWKGSNGSALGCSPDTRTMFRAALQGAARAGQLELLDLRLDGAPLAMLVNFICGRGSFSFKTAFDEDFARFSPGVLLQIENLALLERDGTDWCDSCAAEGHPMIDSLWTGRRHIGRYSVAIGGFARRSAFGMLVKAEQTRISARSVKPQPQINLENREEL